MAAPTMNGARMRLRYGQLNDRSPKADATHHVHAAAGRGTTSASSVAADARASTRARLPARLIAGRPRRRESATARPRNARTSRTPSLAPSGRAGNGPGRRARASPRARRGRRRSEEHTSELQSHSDLVCRLLLEKKKKIATPKLKQQ